MSNFTNFTKSETWEDKKIKFAKEISDFIKEECEDLSKHQFSIGIDLNELPGDEVNLMISYNVGDERSTIINTRLKEVPQCCGMCLCYNNLVYSSYFLNDKLRTIIDNIKTFIAKNSGYSCMMITDIKSGYIRLLERNGWKKIHYFINKRTNNEISVLIKDIS
jgi:hypothetical protein